MFGKQNPVCKVIKHFMDECADPIAPFKHLGFIIMDVLNNA